MNQETCTLLYCMCSTHYYSPEALGIVSGTVFLICAIATQLLFAKNLEQVCHQNIVFFIFLCFQLTIFNSALFSICFMIFLGFTDDTLDLKWRYKIFLPTIASLPLLVAYSGSTSLFVPSAFRGLFMTGEHLTPLGAILDLFVTVDTQAYGAIIDLGGVFLLFMGLLAVFCTNAINIYAGINGLECGQSYIIACSILFFKLYELSFAPLTDDRLFSLVFIIPFLATALGLLRHNWFPADVFVGDTFCYFAGMTFAVVGIHGHFSKTLLLLFIPQILNFLYSIPQLFKIIPCPRHRLPRADPTTHLLHCSTFPCKSSEYKLFKVRADDTECPNCTLICLVLRIFGPMSERNLCMTLLAIQCVNTILVFVIRYYVFGEQV